MIHRSFFTYVFSCLLIFGLWNISQAQVRKPSADMVLKNGTIHTMDPDRPKAQAVAIIGNKISVVGTNADVEPFIGPDTKVIDLEGQAMYPGFKESHGHLILMGTAQLILNLYNVKSYQEMVTRVAEAVKTKKPGEWIIGQGWHQEKWTDKSALTVRGFPTHHALSAVAPDNPVYLRRADEHAGLANANAMARSNISRQTQPPMGGEIIKDKEGNPTGIFVDNAEDLIAQPLSDKKFIQQALELAIQECLQKGITSFDDAEVLSDELEVYRDYANQGKLDMRLYVMLKGAVARQQNLKPEIGLGNGFLTVRAVKLVGDGALGSRGAALLEPYIDDPENTGFFTISPEELLDTARYALKQGLQLCVHAIGDRGNRMVLDAFEQAMQEFPHIRDPRLRIEHAQILDEVDIPRFKKLGVIASMQGIHATSDLPWVPSRIGENRTKEGGYVWQKLLQNGVKIINGTDAPVEDVDPIKNFYASVTRQKPDGTPYGGYGPDQRMTRHEALRSYTLDAAYGSFQEEVLGSIEVGKLADFTVMSKDIMTVPEQEILEAEVMYTIVDGKVRYEKGKPTKPSVP